MTETASGTAVTASGIGLTAAAPAPPTAQPTALPTDSAGLLAAVAVMDRLRAPGGCPWDAAQTHASLVRYLIEECYELVQAIEDGDPVAVREELGDVLLQVLFHARIAEEAADPAERYSIDDVADGLVEKLVRRHPAVFAATETVADASDQQRRWDELKKAENGRASALAGVAMAAPAVALSAKLGDRAALHDVVVPLPEGDSSAEQIFRLAYAAGMAGEDVETAVRDVARQHAERMRAASESAQT